MLIVLAVLVALPFAGYLLVQNSKVQTFIIRKITEQLSRKTNANIRIDKVDIALFDKIVLDNVLVEGLDGDTIFYSSWISADIDTLMIRQKKITFDKLEFKNNQISVVRDTANRFNFSFILDSLRTEKKDASLFWMIKCNDFRFQNSELKYHDLVLQASENVYLRELDIDISDFVNYKDSIRLTINNLKLNNGYDYFLNRFSAGFVATKHKIEINDLEMESKNSVINDLDLQITAAEGKVVLDKNSSIDISLGSSKINFAELSLFVPALNGLKQNVEISGRIFGDINDLKGKNLKIATGMHTRANIDFYINDLDKLETMYLFLDLKNFQTTLTDLAAIDYIQNGKITNLRIPETFYDMGMLTYTGNFSGFLSDFVAFGMLKSNMGKVKTDLSVVPQKGGTFGYNGSISTTDFKFGEFLHTHVIGNLTFNGQVNGNYNFSDKQISGLFKGDIAKIEANDYVYENIKLDGIYMDKMFDGLLSINDTNLQFDFLGRMNLGNEIPEFDFNLDMKKVLPGKLNLSNKFPKAEMAFKMKAKFTGDNVDNLKGLIVVEDGYYKNRFGDFSLKGMQLISVPNDTASELTFTSDFFDVEIVGKYNFKNSLGAIKQNVDAYLPSFSFAPTEKDLENDFIFKIEIKKLEALTTVFAPDLQFQTPFFLYGGIDSEKADIQLEGSMPGMKYKNFWFRNIFISNKIIDNHFSSKFKFGEIMHKSGLQIYDLAIDSEIANDLLLNEISWNTKADSSGHSAIKTRSVFKPSPQSVFPNVEVSFLESQIYLTDTAWQFEPFTATIDSSHVAINGFELHNNNQKMLIDGIVSHDSTDVVTIDITNIDMAYMQQNFNEKNNLSGLVNSTIRVADLYSKPLILAEVSIDSLVYQNQLIGDVNLLNGWDMFQSGIRTELDIVKNGRKSLSATGFYKPEDKSLDYQVVADSLPLNLLGTVIKNQLSGFQGFGSGKVKIGGTLDKLLFYGAVKVENGALKVDYTQTGYFLSDSVYFKSDTIQFKNITIKDKFNNTGKFNGILVHDNFKNMLYDLTITSPKIMALNTSSKTSELFYGDIFANARLTITGRGTTVNMAGSATTLAGTNVNISMDYESDLAQYDFLQFINTNEDKERTDFFAPNPTGDFNMTLNVEATPDAKVQLIYNSQIGDVIKAQGEGILLFEMDKDGDISLSGNYTVTRGEYLFTLENVVNKRFSIAPGGSIVWSGDPYNAIIDLTAIYKLKASLYDLLAESYFSNESLYQRILVECQIFLTEELTNPTIDFGVHFPDEDESVKNELLQFFNTEEERNKQILSLIVLGKFYTPEYMRGQYAAQNTKMIGTTASELFSNQLSNWLSQISNNWDVGFNYRPGNDITDDEMELALSTQIFNNRVILDGNIGNNVNPESSNSSQIVGDFDIKVKLVPSGKIEFKAFNHSNNNLIYETAPYTQGIGLTFKEEYNTLKELLLKIKMIFKKKG